MSQCTWVGCKREARYPQLDKARHQWANLCALHDAELDGAMSGPAKRVLVAWVKASGGAKKLAETM